VIDHQLVDGKELPRPEAVQKLRRLLPSRTADGHLIWEQLGEAGLQHSWARMGQEQLLLPLIRADQHSEGMENRVLYFKKKIKSKPVYSITNIEYNEATVLHFFYLIFLSIYMLTSQL
jgi:hypothetical protein